MNIPIMLGTDWTGENVAGWWVSEKLDGWRAVWTGAKLLTRQGNEYDAPGWFTDGLPTDTPLDAELHLGRGRTHDDVTAAVRAGRWRDLRLAVFDVPAAGQTIETAQRRLGALALPAHAELVQHHRADSTADALATMRAIVAAGGEGVMARRPGSRYQAGRVGGLLKLKRDALDSPRPFTL
jgi:DNA ligase-1